MNGLMHFWEQSAYGLQLFAACSIIICFSEKRENFALRYVMCVVFALASSSVLGMLYPHLTFLVGHLGFWMLFPLLCVFMLMICCRFQLQQVLYYSAITMAVQHIAYDCCVMVNMLLPGFDILLDIFIYLAVYSAMFYVLKKVYPEMAGVSVGLYDLVSVGTIILVVQFLSVIEVSGGSAPELLHNHFCYRIVDALCCAYVLWTQVSRRQRACYEAELVGINQVFILQKEQYKMRQEIIDTINRKCHDLKHQLEAFHRMKDSGEREEYYRELKRDIQIYDMDVDTGNEALNVLLMDKGLYCYEKGIRLSCMGNVEHLSYMKLEDVFAMFGNAIDNAIEAVDELEDAEKRIINLKVVERNHLVIIQLQNYYEGEVVFEKGLPLTTKKDKLNHGFGVKSIRYIAEKYGGTMTATGRDHIFTMQILLPVKKGDDEPSRRTEGLYEHY